MNNIFRDLLDSIATYPNATFWLFVMVVIVILLSKAKND